MFQRHDDEQSLYDIHHKRIYLFPPLDALYIMKETIKNKIKIEIFIAYIVLLWDM